MSRLGVFWFSLITATLHASGRGMLDVKLSGDPGPSDEHTRSHALPCQSYQFFEMKLQMFLSTPLKERRLSGVEAEFQQ